MVSWRSQLKFTEYLYAYSILNYKLHDSITYFWKYVLYTSDPVEEACSDVVAATALAMSEYSTAEKYLERRSTLPDQQACSSTVGKGPQASEQSSGMVLAQGLCGVSREPEAKWMSNDCTPRKANRDWQIRGREQPCWLEAQLEGNLSNINAIKCFCLYNIITKCWHWAIAESLCTIHMQCERIHTVHGTGTCIRLGNPNDSHQFLP